MGFGRGKGFSPPAGEVTEPEVGYGTNDCQPTYDSAGHLCQRWNAGSQTFAPDHSYTVTGLSLMLSQNNVLRKGPWIVKIEAMATNCWEAEVLWSKALYSTDLPLPDVYSFTHIPVDNLELADSTPYRITVHTTLGWFEYVGGAWVSNETIAEILWRYKGTTNPYTRGTKCYGCNYAASSNIWSVNHTEDHWFCLHDVTDPTIKHLDLEIAAGTDDCYTFDANIRLDRDWVQFDYNLAEIHGYMRYLDVAIPSGATILHAYFEGYATGGIAAGSELRIQGIKELDTNTFSTQADADGRAITDANLDWTTLAAGAATWVGRFHDRQELNAIIQEIINQVGWASGNALAIKIYNTVLTRDVRVDSVEVLAGAHSARLHIEYRE